MAKVKNFFIRIGRWFKNHAPTKRRLIQIYSALLFNANIKGFFGKGDNIIYRGNTKVLCSPGLNCYSCPGAVASCPLGALQNALSASNTKAPYYILGILGLLGLMLGRTICGFLCPVGLGQELLYKIKTPKLKKSKYTRILSYFKYVLLIVFVIAIPLLYNTVPGFCKYICPAGTAAATGQLANPNNSDLYSMLGFLFSWKFLLLITFIVLSVFIFRFFCRFICPLGAIYGFFNRISLLGVKLEDKKCIECGLCIQTCQMDIRKVGDHECINCGACIKVCPTHAISWKGSQIFLPKSEIASEEEVVEKPLNALLSVNTTSGSATQPTEVENQPPVEIPEEVKAEENKGDERLKKFKKRSFILQISAWAVALAVLVTALVYYNFLAPTSVSATFGVGDKCPDFVYETIFETDGAYDKDGNKIERYSTIESKGTVTVINYWYTTCGPCVAELPGFNRVKEEFGDEIIMIAVHAYGMVSNRMIQQFIDTADNDHDVWSDYSIMFALDNEQETYTMLGGKSTYPMTVIVDKDGIISYVQQGPMSEENLRTQINKTLGKL